MLWGWLLGIISYIHYNSCWRSMICYKTDKWIYSKLESGDGPDIHPKSWISWIKVLNIYLEFCLWANSSQGGNMNDNIWEMSWCSIRLALFHQGIVPKTGTKIIFVKLSECTVLFWMEIEQSRYWWHLGSPGNLPLMVHIKINPKPSLAS